jgi:hypothetical protein
MNAVKHGLLSGKLILEGEAPEDYQALMGGLERSLQPKGTLELALVEKVAIALWKQRRLVAAETASVLVESLPPVPGGLVAFFPMCEDGADPYADTRAAAIKDRDQAPINASRLHSYQVALDGELYRAMNALHRQQEWRIKSGIEPEGETIEGHAGGEVSENP